MFANNGSGVMVSGDSRSRSSNSIANIGNAGNIRNSGNTGSIDRIDTIQTLQSKNNTYVQVNRQLQGDSSKLQIFRQQASTISHALWPGNLHRSEALSKAPQRRRHSHASTHANTHLAHSRFGGGMHFLPDYAPLLLVGIAIIVVGSIAMSFLLHRWFILLIPVFMLTITTLLIGQAFYEHMQGNVQQNGRLSIQQTPRTFRSFPGISSVSSISGIPSSRRAFDTPMPKTPLVRELETYDLSQTNVEHFLDANNPQDSKEHALGK